MSRLPFRISNVIHRLLVGVGLGGVDPDDSDPDHFGLPDRSDRLRLRHDLHRRLFRNRFRLLYRGRLLDYFYFCSRLLLLQQLEDLPMLLLR